MILHIYIDIYDFTCTFTCAVATLSIKKLHCEPFGFRLLFIFHSKVQCMHIVIKTSNNKYMEWIIDQFDKYM